MKNAKLMSIKNSSISLEDTMFGINILKILLIDTTNVYSAQMIGSLRKGIVKDHQLVREKKSESLYSAKQRVTSF